MGIALIVRYLAIPYTVALVVVGLLLSTLGIHSQIRLDHDLIVNGFLPLLLFEASLRVDVRVLRQALPAIIVLAGPGVVVSMLVVAAVLHVTIGVPMGAAVVFGALISATDPVAVLALFRELHLPTDLTMLVEGESVLNDGTALVIFSLLLPIAEGAHMQYALATARFVIVVAGGLSIGAVCGWAAAWLVGWTSDHLVELGLTVILAYGSFLIAQALGVSGVIACVVAGLVFASQSRRKLSSSAEEILTDVWEFAAFVANSLLFLLLGLLVSIESLAASAVAIGWAIFAAILGRLIVVYGMGFLLRLARHPLLLQHRHLVFWSGLRGALAIALVFSLPVWFAEGELFRRLTVGVVLFTVLVQGLTVRPLIRWVIQPSTN